MSFPRYPAYKDSGVEWLGEVPAHWEVGRLKYACQAFPSNIDKKSYEGEEPIRLCNYTDVYYNDRIVDGMNFMEATATAAQIAKFALRAGDTIITKDSETADDIAKAAYVPSDLPGVVCGYHLSIVRPKGDVRGAFVKRLFDSRYAAACFEVSANGLTRVGLGQYAVDNAAFPWPPVQEQTAIAAFLDRETAQIDALIAEQERLIELLKEKRQAVISHAVTKGLDPDVPMKNSGVEWLGKVPAHWEVRRLGSLASIVRGASPRPAGDTRYFHGNHTPWVTVAEITKDDNADLSKTREFLTEEGAKFSRLFRRGTLIYSNSGATLGVPKILRLDACANDGVVGFENLSTELTTAFLYHHLSALTQTIREMIKQGAGQPNLNTDIVKTTAISLPPMDEQVAICAYVSEIVSEFNALGIEAERAIALLNERRSALISAAVTGQIDVRSLNVNGAVVDA